MGRTSWSKRIRGKLGAEARVHSHKEGESEEPTRDGGGPEPVERRGSKAATLPQALQSGIVRCPPTPQGSRQEGEAPGIGSTPPMPRGTGGHRTHGECRGQGIKQHETEQKQRKKIRVSHCSDSWIGLHIGGEWEGREMERQGGPGSSLL